MGAKVLILAKSLIPNFLRACAIVHCQSAFKLFRELDLQLAIPHK